MSSSTSTTSSSSSTSTVGTPPHLVIEMGPIPKTAAPEPLMVNAGASREDMLQTEAERIGLLLKEMYATSDEFYMTSVKGKDLEALKPLGDKVRKKVYDCLKILIKKRREEKLLCRITNARETTAKFDDLLPSMEAIRNLRFIYKEMIKKENTIITWLIRKIGANPKLSALATVVAGAVLSYTAIAYGIAPSLSDPTQAQIMIISAVVGTIVAYLASLAFNYFQNKYESLKVSDEELQERVLLSRYFRRFGRLDFEGCIELLTPPPPKKITNETTETNITPDTTIPPESAANPSATQQTEANEKPKSKKKEKSKKPKGMSFKRSLDFNTKLIEGLKLLALDSLTYHQSNPHRHALHQHHAKKYRAVPGQVDSSSDSEKRHSHRRRKAKKLAVKATSDAAASVSNGLTSATFEAVRMAKEQFLPSAKFPADAFEDESGLITSFLPRFDYNHSDSEDSDINTDTESDEDNFEAENMLDTTPAAITKPSEDVVQIDG